LATKTALAAKAAKLSLKWNFDGEIEFSNQFSINIMK
jgi:hypothetical protein